MRKRHLASHENHERWLVSYADFITLLFAFFVVMFASNQTDRHRAKLVSDSVRDALEHGQISSRLSNILGKGRREGTAPDHAESSTAPSEAQAKENRPPDLAKSMANLQKGLAGELAAGKVVIKLEGRGLVIDLREAAFFASGDDSLAPGSFPILDKIAAEIQAVPNHIRLEGFTDSVPIHNSRFRSNWELSAARAIALLEALAGRYQVDRARMGIAGYGENAPVDTNDTEEGRAHNRRVSLVLLTEQGQKAEPDSAARSVP
jgi:chemotaxis protein MotB